ncbi:hypothetical protein F4553_002955 [Allocatelliglobosispora scoriae]|uniref:Uncharacterized protein n=1 Tax=Allocatelliglobosispora scoriae TaxID=643052 RepID=A0A841BQH5_9ACTN|nr:hypothetical protein [Allocatelliglobosispora scoriae]MBB5869576.1 hypothetical protein [Allocatelliglobosispora scoriae]
MGGTGIGTWIALISCPAIALLILVLLFRSDSGGRKKKRPAKVTKPAASAEPGWGSKPVAPKNPIAISSRPDYVQLQVTAQQIASAAGAAVLTARAAAKQAAHAGGELARLTVVRDAAAQAHEQVKASIVQVKAAQKAMPEPTVDEAQKEVGRAALAAYRRGDISVDELHAVWKRVDGWDEVREEREKELSRLRVEETKLRKALEAAEEALAPARRNAQHMDAIARARGQEAAAADQAARAAYAAAETARQAELRKSR